jgi:hypothetical protein
MLRAKARVEQPGTDPVDGEATMVLGAHLKASLRLMDSVKRVSACLSFLILLLGLQIVAFGAVSLGAWGGNFRGAVLDPCG